MNDIVVKINAVSILVQTLLAVPAVASSAEAKAIVSELQGHLRDVKTQLAELSSESDALRDKLRQVASPAEVVVEDGKYFSRDGDGPFCTACYDLQRTLVPLHPLPPKMQNVGKWRCPVCSAHYH